MLNRSIHSYIVPRLKLKTTSDRKWKKYSKNLVHICRGQYIPIIFVGKKTQPVIGYNIMLCFEINCGILNVFMQLHYIYVRCN